jgi:hypothetical protein
MARREVEAAISGNSDHNRFIILLRMEPFTQVKTVLATDRAATSGAFENFMKVVYALKRNIGYFHSSEYQKFYFY